MAKNGVIFELNFLAPEGPKFEAVFSRFAKNQRLSDFWGVSKNEGKIFQKWTQNLESENDRVILQQSRVATRPPLFKKVVFGHLIGKSRQFTSKSDKNVIFDKNGKNRNFVKIGVF